MLAASRLSGPSMLLMHQSLDHRSTFGKYNTDNICRLKKPSIFSSMRLHCTLSDSLSLLERHTYYACGVRDDQAMRRWSASTPSWGSRRHLSSCQHHRASNHCRASWLVSGAFDIDQTTCAMMGMTDAEHRNPRAHVNSSLVPGSVRQNR